jgi:hypothetical protein
MAVFVIYAAHAHTNTSGDPPEVTRTHNREIAESIADKLRVQKFTTKEGVRVKRYSAVYVRELADDKS